MTLYIINRTTKEHKLFDMDTYLPGPTSAWCSVEADAEGWIPFNGSECPLPNDALCRVRLRSGFTSHNSKKAHIWIWEKHGAPGDIVAYRPVINAEPQTTTTKSCVFVPDVGSKWEHHSGRIYRVECIANGNTTRPDQYPVTVVYRNTDNGTLWSRPASDWNRSFKPYRNLELEERAIAAMKAASAEGDRKRGGPGRMPEIYAAIRDGKIPGVQITGSEA